MQHIATTSIQVEPEILRNYFSQTHFLVKLFFAFTFFCGQIFLMVKFSPLSFSHFFAQLTILTADHVHQLDYSHVGDKHPVCT